jgi:hypothetical protein
MDHEISHGRDITWTLRAVAAGFRVAVEAPKHITEAWAGTSWIVKVTASGTRDGKPFQATHLQGFTRRTFRCDTSLRTTPEALLRLSATVGALRRGTGSVTPSSMRTPTATGVMAPA